ncbi:hypothetical protein AAG612_00660 [Citromicrobium bathyomarinum]|uniref:hypothetical protein n=1 Tax=Citromicrobium bathyomarinum TaxID=72174 RepID=UPI00315A8495
MKHDGTLVPGEVGLPAEDGFDRKRVSFTRKVALRMIVLAFCAAGIVALFSFFAARNEAEDTLVGEWKTQIELRGQYESQRFLDAEKLTDRMAEKFVALYSDPSVASSTDFSNY